MCSTACWNWDARSPSASPNLDGAGVLAPPPLIHATRLWRAPMTMRASLEGPDTAHSAHPNGSDKSGIVTDVSAGTAGLPAPALPVPTVVILSDVRFLQEALAELLGREAGLAVIG